MSNSQALRPKNITLNKTAGELVIVWGDDQSCIYPLNNLREACPCVECRGGHENMGQRSDPAHILALTPTRSYAMTSLELIGNYALQPYWDDGHHTGLYTWDYLRRLCPPLTANAAQ